MSCLFGLTPSPSVMPQGSQTICNSLTCSWLIYFSMRMCGPYLSGTPQVHYARLAFILALDPVQNVPHSKFSNLTHPPTTSSE